MKIDDASIICKTDLSRIGENLPLSLGFGPLLRHIVNPQDDILSRHDDGFSVSRRQDVVGGHHEDSSFGLSFN